jgi:predicted RND superfamily exporter protein
MFKRLTEKVSRPLGLVALASLLTLAAGAGLLGLTVDNGLRVWFVGEDPAMASYTAFLESFGNDEVVVIALSEESSALSPQRLRRVERLTQALDETEGVARVVSLSRAPFLPSAPWRHVQEEGQAAFSQRVKESPLGKRLLSDDGQASLVLAWMESEGDVDQRRPEILGDIRSAISATASDPMEGVKVAGMGVMYEAINQATLRQGGLFIGLSYLIIALALLLFVRDWRWVLVSLVAVTGADVAVLGLMGWAGIPLTMYTMTLPSVVLILGVANGVHLATALKEGRGVRSALLPCLLNAVTTAAGFLSLNAASVSITRTFGTFAALGVLSAFLLCAVGAAFLVGTRPDPAPGHGGGLWPRLLTALGSWSQRRRVWVLVVFAVGALVSSMGMGRLEADTRSIDFLPDNHAFVLDHHALEKEFGPYVPLEMVIRRPPGQTWRDPAFLTELSKARRLLQNLDAVGGVLSVLDLIEAVDADPRTPLESDLVLFDLLAPPDALNGLATDADNAIRLTATLPMMSAKAFKNLAQEAQQITQASFSDGSEVTVSGYLPLNWAMAEHVVQDQIRSFGLAFLAVFGVLALFLRSFRLLIAALAVNLFPIVALFGWMGWMGHRLDIASVTVCAAVLGIIVDDTVHLLHRFKIALRDAPTVAMALQVVAASSGRAVFFTSLIFIAGFSTIAFSPVPSVSVVGELTAIAVAFALISDLVLLPALLGALYGKRFGRRVKSVWQRARNVPGLAPAAYKVPANSDA